MKMRGSRHSKEIREFEITSDGLQLLDPIRAYTGVITGIPAGGDSQALRHLPAEARGVIETLRRQGPADCDAVAKAAGLDPDLVRRELVQLEQQGLVLLIRRGDAVVYRATV